MANSNKHRSNSSARPQEQKFSVIQSGANNHLYHKELASTSSSSGKQARQQRQRQPEGSLRGIDRTDSYESNTDLANREAQHQLLTNSSLNTSSASSSGYNGHNNFYSHQRKQSKHPTHLQQQQQQQIALMRSPMMLPMMIDDEEEDQDELNDTHLIYDGADSLSQQYKLISAGIQQQQHQQQRRRSQYMGDDDQLSSDDQCVDSDIEAAYLSTAGTTETGGHLRYHLGEEHASSEVLTPHLAHPDHNHPTGRDTIHVGYNNRLAYQLSELQQQFNQQQHHHHRQLNNSSRKPGINKFTYNTLHGHHHQQQQRNHNNYSFKNLISSQTDAAIYQQPEHLRGYPQTSLTYSPHLHKSIHHPRQQFTPPTAAPSSIEPSLSDQHHYIHQQNSSPLADHSTKTFLLSKFHSYSNKQQQQQQQDTNQRVVEATGVNKDSTRKSAQDSKKQVTSKGEMQASNSRQQLNATPDQHLHYARRKNTSTSHKRSTSTPQLDKENQESALSWCGKLGKSLLFVANLLFWLTGIALGAWGILSLVDDHKYNLSQLLVFEPSSKMSLFQLLSWSFITLGCATILVGVCGCSAILKNNRWILGLYIFLILAIFVLDLATGLLAIIFQERLVANVRLRLANKLRSDYGVHASFTAAIDYLQTKFECCGLEGHFDYDQSLWRLQRLGGFDATVARTCCYLRNTFDDQAHINPRPVNESMCQSTDVRFHQSYRYRKGCMDDLERLIRQKIWTFTLGCGAVGGIILLSLFFATCFCRSINPKSSRKSSAASTNREHYSKGNHHQHHHNQDKKSSGSTITNAQHQRHYQ